MVSITCWRLSFTFWSLSVFEVSEFQKVIRAADPNIKVKVHNTSDRWAAQVQLIRGTTSDRTLKGCFGFTALVWQREVSRRISGGFCSSEVSASTWEVSQKSLKGLRVVSTLGFPPGLRSKRCLLETPSVKIQADRKCMFLHVCFLFVHALAVCCRLHGYEQWGHLGHLVASWEYLRHVDWVWSKPEQNITEIQLRTQAVVHISTSSLQRQPESLQAQFSNPFYWFALIGGDCRTPFVHLSLLDSVLRQPWRTFATTHWQQWKEPRFGDLFWSSGCMTFHVFSCPCCYMSSRQGKWCSNVARMLRKGCLNFTDKPN